MSLIDINKVWITLLKHPKTKLVAVRCFIYMTDILHRGAHDRCWPDVKFEHVGENPTNCKEPVKPYKNTVHWKRHKLVLSLPESASVETLEKLHVDFLEHHADLLARAMNALLNVPSENRNLISSIECRLFSLYKPVADSEYKQFKASKEVEKIVKEFTDFAMKNGGFTIQMAEIIMASFAYIGNRQNLNFPTPIHLATLNNDLDVLIILLSNKFAADEKDIEGHTALELAVKNNKLVFAKALILFGPELSKTRQKLMKKMALCDQMRQILKLCGPRPEKNWKRISPNANRHIMNALHKQGPKTHLLSLDGGGIRGLVLTTILAEIEAVIGKDQITKRFEFLAGSSTGAILAIALSLGKSIAECRDIYFRMKDIVFYRKYHAVPYNHKLLEQFLVDELRGCEKMVYLTKTCQKFVILTSSDTSVTPMKTVLFKSYKLRSKYDEPSEEMEETTKDCDASDSDDSVTEANKKAIRQKRLPKPSFEKCRECKQPVQCLIVETAAPKYDYDHYKDKKNYNLRTKIRREDVFDENWSTSATCPFQSTITLAARCSSAAPTYFDSPDGKHKDGGIIANNPCEMLLTEFHNINNAFVDNLVAKMTMGVVLSVGTGHVKEKESKKCVINCGARLTNSVLGFGQEFCSTVGRSDGHIVDHSKDHVHALKGAFFRFSPTLDEDVELDETNNEELIDMMWRTKEYMRNQRATYELEMLGEILKQ